MSLGKWKLVGIVSGGVIAIILIAVCVTCAYRRYVLRYCQV